MKAGLEGWRAGGLPVHRWLAGKLKGRVGLSAGIITLLVPVLLAGPLVSPGAAFVDQVAGLITHLQEQPLRFDASLLTQMERYPGIGGLAEWLRQHLTATTEQLQGWLVSAAQAPLTSVAATGGNFLLGAMGTVVDLFVMLFLLFFLLRDGRHMLGRTVRLVPMERP
ncbi:MAG: AI-2E family transporter [Chromatiaceae bacterium]|nr:AI-2E family transporter [Chromatiaceae bacterium]